jgi:UDP-glucose 4-epimerase
MRILITGNLGFVGSETTKLLEKEGYEIIGYDLMAKCDIRDADLFFEACNETQPDRVLHLAAIARFADADKDPKLAFETNVIGTRNVVEVCQELHIPLVYASTGSAIMPLNEYEPPFDETIPARGNSVYGCTKAMGEYLVREHTPHMVLRYGHLFGAEKKFHGLIGGFLSRIERGLAPELYGGLQTNSMVYIMDIARANLLALTADWSSWNQIYNIGSPEEISAEDAAKVICDVFDYKGEIIKKPGRTVDPSRFAFNVKKAEVMLGFKPEFTFLAGLKHMKKVLDDKEKRSKS